MGGLLSCCENCFGGGGDDSGRGGRVGGASQDTYQNFHADSLSGGGSRIQPQPDAEERRRQVAEAAEKRRQEQERRGVKNPNSVRRQQQRQEEMERMEEEAMHRGPDDKPTMRWQMS